MYGYDHISATSCGGQNITYSCELSSPNNNNNNNVVHSTSSEVQDNNNVQSMYDNNRSAVGSGNSRKEPKSSEDDLVSESIAKLSREERRKRRRATQKYRSAHASRERVRVGAFNVAFRDLRQLLPTLPPNKKLSKIEILRMAICYISYLSHILDLNSDQHYMSY